MNSLLAHLFIVLSGASVAHAADSIIPSPTNTGVTPAAAIGSDLSSSVNNLFGGNDGIITQVTNLIGVVAGSIAVIYIIWAGVQYIMSGGDPAKTKAARGRIISAMIGIVIIIAVYAFIRLGVGIGRLVDTTTQG